jgi:hypothetical protein
MAGHLRRRFLWTLKNTLNRLTTRAARSGRGVFSLIRHVGRRSGRTYETPVILAEVPGGFVAELTYPPEQGLAAYPYPQRLLLRLTGRREFRLLTIAPDAR